MAFEVYRGSQQNTEVRGADPNNQEAHHQMRGYRCEIFRLIIQGKIQR